MERSCYVTLSVCLICFAKAMFDSKREAFCSEYQECRGDRRPVCGVRTAGARTQLRLFDNECELIKFGCHERNTSDAYGIINMEFCERSFSKANSTVRSRDVDACNVQCGSDVGHVCGVRQHGTGFKVRLFRNACELGRFSCENNVTFYSTDAYYCDGLAVSQTTNREKDDSNGVISERPSKEERLLKSVVVSDGTMFHLSGDVNDTFDNFMESTHISDMPLTDIRGALDEDARRMLVRIFGPVMVFRPAVEIPRVIHDDDPMYKPTLSTCFHKCPTECPDTYKPVCGVSSQESRSQSLVFQNHCYMDAMQCKARWDPGTYWDQWAEYAEATFVMCLSDSINAAYKFGPAVRTLRHMGRLRNRARFRYRVRNLRHYNELVNVQPNIRG